MGLHMHNHMFLIYLRLASNTRNMTTFEQVLKHFFLEGTKITDAVILDHSTTRLVTQWVTRSDPGRTINIFLFTPINYVASLTAINNNPRSSDAELGTKPHLIFMKIWYTVINLASSFDRCRKIMFYIALDWIRTSFIYQSRNCNNDSNRCPIS